MNSAVSQGPVQPEIVVPTPTSVDEGRDQKRTRSVQALRLTRVLSARAAYGLDGAGVTVAILDTGIRDSHLCFRGEGGRSYVLPGRNVTHANLSDTGDTWDEHGHGTHVASLVAEAAPKADLVMVKVLSARRATNGNTTRFDASGSMESVADGLSWVLEQHEDHNISVVCLSLGVVDPGDKATSGPWMRVRQIIEQLTAQNVVVVAAAGNLSKGATEQAQAQMTFPATLVDCISVGATHSHHETSRANGDRRKRNVTQRPMQLMDQSRRQPGKTAFGTTLLAPGDQVLGAGHRSDRQLTEICGTSQAAPLVAGAVALLQQRYRSHQHQGRPGDAHNSRQLPVPAKLVDWLVAGAKAVDEQGNRLPDKPPEAFLFLDVTGAVAALDREFPLAVSLAPLTVEAKNPEHSKPSEDERPVLAPESAADVVATPYQPPLSVEIRGAGERLWVDETFSKLYAFLTRPTTNPLTSGAEVTATFHAEARSATAAPLPAGSIDLTVKATAGSASQVRHFIVDPRETMDHALVEIGWMLIQCLANEQQPLFRVTEAYSAPGKALRRAVLENKGSYPSTQAWTEPPNQQRFGVLMVFRENTDVESFAAQEDILRAKQQHLPILQINVAHDGSHLRDRSFPYDGNVTVLSNPESGTEIVIEALKLLLKQLHFVRQVEALEQLVLLPADRTVMVQPPELIDCLSHDGILIYPDPPITRAAADILHQHRPRLKTATPTMLANCVLSGSNNELLVGKQVALSMSQPEDLAAQGLLRHHMADAVVDIARHLISYGATIVYGGLLPEQTLSSESWSLDAGRGALPNYTSLLVRLVQDYAPRGKRKGRLKNHRPYIDSDGVKAQRIESHAGMLCIEPGPDPATELAGLSIDEELVKLRALDSMREEMIGNDYARIILGGKRFGFLGRYPGLLQETWMAMTKNVPLYLIGGFGGLARDLAELILGDLSGVEAATADDASTADQQTPLAAPRTYLTDAALRQAPTTEAWRQAFADRIERYAKAGIVETADLMSQQLQQWGERMANKSHDGIVPEYGWRWPNGLTTEENKRLAVSRSVPEIVTLITSGLQWRARKRQGDRPLIPLRICKGSIAADEVRSDAYLLAVFSDVDVVGPATALNRRLDGAIGEALDNGKLAMDRYQLRWVPALNTEVCFVGLGSAADWSGFRPDERQIVLKEAAKAGVLGCLSRGCQSITTVLMGIESGALEAENEPPRPLSVSTVLDCIVDGAAAAWGRLASKPGFAGITICEINDARFNELQQHVEAQSPEDKTPPRFQCFEVVRPSPRQQDEIADAATLVVDRMNDVYRWKWMSTAQQGTLHAFRSSPDAAELHGVLQDIQDDNHTEHWKWLASMLFDNGKPASEQGQGSAPSADTHDLDFPRLVAARARGGNGERKPSSITVVCPPDAAHLPFEGLRFGEDFAKDKENDRASHPGLCVPMVRRLAIEGKRARKWPERLRSSGMRVLIIADPSDLLAAVQQEVDALRGLIQGGTDGSALSAPGERPCKLMSWSEVTTEAIIAELNRVRYDVVHFSGHAFYDEEQPSNSGLLCYRGEILTAAHLKQVRQLPRLAFINACESARIQDVEIGEPATAGTSGHLHGGLAEQLLAAGIDNYIGTQWPVLDKLAGEFARELYEQLGSGITLGKALLAVRAKLWRSDVCWSEGRWASYVCYGSPDLRLRVLKAAPDPPPILPSATP